MDDKQLSYTPEHQTAKSLELIKSTLESILKQAGSQCSEARTGTKCLFVLVNVLAAER